MATAAASITTGGDWLIVDPEPEPMTVDEALTSHPRTVVMACLAASLARNVRVVGNIPAHLPVSLEMQRLLTKTLQATRTALKALLPEELRVGAPLDPVACRSAMSHAVATAQKFSLSDARFASDFIGVLGYPPKTMAMDVFRETGSMPFTVSMETCEAFAKLAPQFTASLTSLDLTWGSFSISLKPIGHLRLTSLDLTHTSLTEGLDNLSALRGTLTTLKLDKTSYADYRPVGELTQLTSLSLASCHNRSGQFREFDFLRSLTKLTDLNVSNSSPEFSDLGGCEVIGTLSALTSLDISCSYSLWGIDALRDLKALQRLNMSRCHYVRDSSGWSGTLDPFAPLALPRLTFCDMTSCTTVSAETLAAVKKHVEKNGGTFISAT